MRLRSLVFSPSVQLQWPTSNKMNSLSCNDFLQNAMRGSKASKSPKSVKGNTLLKILHIGDSFSSGTGAGAYYTTRGTCYRSTKTWGDRYATLLKNNGFAVQYTNRACSGAVTAHYNESRVFSMKVGCHVPCQRKMKSLLNKALDAT